MGNRTVVDALRQDDLSLSLTADTAQSRTATGFGTVAAIALGAVAFLVFCGWTVLIPSNIAWLTVADRAMHTLGWMFFRDTPWSIPPGANPRLGIELGNSIGLVDGLPLFALPLKLLSPLLPQPFQYWGYWLLLCFVLQSVFAYRIARELGASLMMALVAAGFVLITPAFLFRVPMHLALSGHFVVLAALYLYVRRTPPPLWMWPLLCAGTAAIHIYLLAMVGGLWFAATVQRLWLKRMTGRAAILETGLIAGSVLLVLWTAGFFFTGSLGSYGYGDYKLNLLWPFIRYSWSQVFPDIPHTRYDYEGMSFLGIGVLALLAVAVMTGAIGRLRATTTRTWLPLAVMLVLMMLFAISANLHVSDNHLGKLPLPKAVEDVFSAFRSTGRFIWPMLYFITIGVVVLVARRFRPAIAVPLALIAFAAQTVDSAPAWQNFAKRMPAPSSVWHTGLDSPFWERAAAAGYNRLRVIPAKSPGTNWKAFGYYAVTHGMDIDSAYLGRTDAKELEALKAEDARALDTGDFEPHTIYILDVRSVLAAAQHLQRDDLLAVINGQAVFVRHGAPLVEGLGIDPHEAVGLEGPRAWVPSVG